MFRTHKKVKTWVYLFQFLFALKCHDWNKQLFCNQNIMKLKLVNHDISTVG